MIANGIYQWNEHYPNPSAFENDVKRDELYVLEIDDSKWHYCYFNIYG